MSFSLTPNDDDLVRRVKIKVESEPITGFNFRGGEIPLQFPPFITNDSKNLNWTINEAIPFGYESIVAGFDSTVRQVSLKLQYVATGHTSNGVKWDTQNISDIVKDIRGYFYPANLKEGTSTSQMPIFRIEMFEHIPAVGVGATFRGISMAEKPGDTYITIDDVVYSFVTEISLSLELVTNVKKQDSPYYEFSNLKEFPSPKWY
tara:strand:+ start:22049 stop:22660 length:612 start_codon:yes stop_codon:yes gene_type:complete